MSRKEENRWHHEEFRSIFRKADYAEWKYFNFITEECSGVFAYALIDPLNMMGRGGGRVLGRVYAREGAEGGVERFGADEMDLSTSSVDAVFGKNRLKVLEGGAYEISGSAGSVSWNLRYESQAPPIEGFLDHGMVPLDLEKASWFVKMPRAKVSGTVILGGKERVIEGVGYADANWGSAIPVLASFNWAQCSDEKIAIAMGDMQTAEIAGMKIGHWSALYAWYGGELIMFPEKSLRIDHVEWGELPESGLKVPMRTEVKAENTSHAISLSLVTEYSDPFRFVLPLAIPVQPVIVEQVMRASGVLLEKDGEKTRSLHSFSARGFKEYTFRDVSMRKGVSTGVVIE